MDARPDLLSARVAARAQGSRVEAESERSGTSTTWVNPDGTLTTEQHQGLIRFRESDGSWRDVDLTMAEQADGTVAPKGHPGGLRLKGATKSASGAPLSTTENDVISTDEGKGGANGVSLAWKGRLGKPVLAGNRATYAEVQPGVDLVVDALRTGYEQSLVIKTPAALAGLSASGAELSWSLPVKTRGLTARAETDGSVSFVDAKDVVASRLVAPKAWDAVVDPRSGEHTSTAAVKLTVAQQGKGKAVVTMTPDQGWLSDPARVFPITIDPTYASATQGTSFDTYVSSLYPTAKYSAATELRVGTYGSGDKYRSFLTFPLATIKGKDVISASLSLYEFHSWSCTASTFYVYSAYGSDINTNWSNQPAAVTSYGSLNTAKGWSSSCAAGRVSVPVTSLITAWSGSTSSAGAIRLHASETDTNGWKKFYSVESTQDPYITFTYNRKPNAATAPTVANVGTYGGVSYAWKPQPVVSSVATDPDASGVSMTIEAHSSTTTSTSTLKSSCVTPVVASGATGSCTLSPALADNTTVYLRSAVKDDRGLWNGTWSPWKTLKTAQATPAAPTVTCPGYANGSWADTPPAAALSCTIATTTVGNNAPVTVVYSIDGATAVTKAVTQGPTSFTVTVPNTAGAHKVEAWGQTASTITTTHTVLQFGYGSAGLTIPAAAPRVTTTGAIKIGAAGPPRGTSGVPTAKVKWRAAGSGSDELVGWNNAASAPLTVTDNGLAGVSVSGSWNTKLETTDAFTDSNPVLAGVQPTTLNERVPVLLDVQVCLTYTSGTQCTWSADKTTVLRVPHAFGNGFPTTDAGPGQVALFTGEFNTSDTDVTVPGYTGNLSISRSHSTFSNSTTAATDPATSVFGPGWTAQFDGADAGAAGMQVVDGTALDGTIALIDADGSALVYGTPTGARRTTATLATGTYVPVDDNTDLAGSTLKVASNTTMTLTDQDGTVTTYTATKAPATGIAGVFAPATVAEPGAVGATTYTRDAAGRITRILAPVPPGVTCPATGTLVAGCRALRIVYGTTTAGSEVTGQVKEIWLDIYDPAKAGGAGMTSVQVAAYGYDSSKRLVSESDPRSTIAATTYAYDTGNHLTQVASAGQTPIVLAYAGSDPKLANVTRARPAGDPAGGTATLASFVYAVPVFGAGLPDLSAASVAGWAQAKAPTYGAAAFGPDHPVASTDPANISTADWAYADLSYTDEAGYTTNTASYGAGAWQPTSTDYDAHGNVVRSLDAGAIAAVIKGGNPGAADQLATTTVYNPTDILATDGTGTVLTPAGSQVTDVYGPARQVALSGTTDGSTVAARPHTSTLYDQGAPNGGKNPVSGVGYGLPTKTTMAAADPGTGTDLQVISQTLTGYSPIDSKPDGDPTSGWVLGSATTTTKDMDLSGTINTGDITTRARFDSEGHTVESRQPSSGAGTSTPLDAGTTLSAYYTTAAQGAPNTACGGTPQWAGLACRTYPSTDPSAGAGGASTLPDSTTTGYNLLLQPTTTVEKSAAVTRTSTSTYLPDGRPDTTRTTVTGLASSTPQAGSQTLYDAVTGLATRVIKLDPVTGAPTTVGTTTAYDAWGRATAFTSDAGDTAATVYDAAGRVSVASDAKGAVAYTYDGADANGATEHRGQATKLQVTRTGTNPAVDPVLTYTGAYDANGALTRQIMPGGITKDTGLDVAGQPKTLSYSGQVTPVTETTDPVTGQITYTPGTPTTAPWLTWSQTNDINGRVAREWTPAGAAAFADGPSADKLAEVQPYDAGDALGFDRTYTYDRADRLTKVADRTTPVTGVTFDPTDPNAAPQVGCTIRSYAFTGNSGDNGSRTASTSTDYPGGDCATAPGAATTRTHGYDTADRPTTGAAINGGPAGTPYVYDQLGRQTTLPGVDAPDPAKGDVTLAYYDTDLPQAVTQGGTTTSYTLNVDGRRQVSTTGPTGGAVTSTTTRHYTDTSDNPAWIDKDGAVTRSTQSLTGDLGATITDDGTATLPLATLHGDNVTNITIPAAQTESTPCTTIGAWSDYTEFGTPRDTTATTAVAGSAGYGWLGAKERSTTTESAGLTLMGDRLYNAVTGRFTSMDPEPGGSATPYGYPTDPINMYDLNGHWWGWRTTFRRVATFTGYAAAGACILATAGLCMGATALAIGASIAWNGYQKRYGNDSGKRVSWKRTFWNIGVDSITARFRPVRFFRYRRYVPRHSVSYFARHNSYGTRSFRWTARHYRRHTAVWGGVNAYYGYRAYKNGW
ncbi:MAG: DNRLRE domain-containing protein [Dermatophilaceae bacterium]